MPDRFDELVGSLRDLIRIPSVNPPDPARPAEELRVARYLADRLAEVGLAPEVVEPVPGRGSVHVRLRGDGTGGGPLLLLSHLDVVPAPPERWSHDPFGAEVEDGYVYGRGAVDMKAMVALELAVVRRLASEARAAGVDPAHDPIPDLRRDVLFTCAADEEAGGIDGARWLAANRPDWLRADGALNEAGAVSVAVAGRRLYPIGVAEKGYAVYRIRVTGTWGHGSVPRPDNAAVLAARVVDRLARPGPLRITGTMARFLEDAATAIGEPGAALLRRIGDGDASAEAEIEAACPPHLARTLRAVVRDTMSPDVIHAGVKYNVIPGDAVIEVDARVLPGTSEAEMRTALEARLGDDLRSACTVELVVFGEPVAAPAEGPLWDAMTATLRDHDPDGVVLPVLVPFATDAKQTIPLGTPTYGFSPLRLAPDEWFLERFHGIDERVSLDALRFGLAVLDDVVDRYCR